MSQVISYARVALVLLVVCCWSTQVALAQIAPTNSATISGSVSDVAGKPVAHAKVSLSGPKSASTQTDTQGLFVFVGVPFGTYSISAAAAGLGTATRSVSVQGDVNVAIQYEPASMNGLKVIANVSSSANAHFNVTPASVTQVNPIANAFEGKTSWRTILEQIPGVAQAGLANGQYGEAAYPDGPLVPVEISINGALPYETATLLDDMPLIGMSAGFGGTGSGTNLGLYPLNGFDSADVVRGPGANAPSIVDSIGGSFVLHSPGAVDHNQYDLSLSTDAYGGIVANARAAVRWKKLSAVVTYGVNDSPGPLSSVGIVPNVLYGFGIASVDGTPATGYVPTCTPPACQSGYLLYAPGYSSYSTPFYGYQGGLFICCTNDSTAWTQHSASVALRYSFSPNVSAEVFYAGENSLMPELGAYQPFDFLPPPGYTGAIQPGMSLINEATLQGDGVTTFQNVSSLLEEKITAQLGRGILQLAALQNRTFDTTGLIYPTSANVKLYGAGCVFGSAPATPATCPSGGTLTLYNGGTYSVTFPAYDQYTTGEANNRDLLVSYATPLGTNFHAGASFVKSYYDGPSTSYFNFPLYSLVCNTITPSAISQTTNEMRVFAGGNLSEKTSLDLSMYFVNANYHVPDPNNLASYATPGADINYVDSNYSYAAPRLGFVWRPTAAVAVRAAAGGGFAEAPLQDLVGSNAPACYAPPACTETSPNLNLRPETSFGFDLGTDIKLPRNTILSFDVYHTNLYGQLYETTTSTGSCPICTGLPLYVTRYGNLGESRYEGILLDVRHTVPHGTYWSLSGGLTRGYVVSVPAGFYNGTTYPYTFPYTPCTNCANLNVVPGVNFNGTFTNGASVPYAQGLGTLGYRWNADKYVDLVATYFGNNNTYFRPAFVEFDGNIGYPLTRNVSLLVTFRNITGIYDGSYQIQMPDNLSGAPTVSGLPYVLYGEMYGPRTIILTTNVRL